MLILNLIERKRASTSAPAPPIVPPRIAVVDDLDAAASTTVTGLVEFVELVELVVFVELEELVELLVLLSSISVVYLSNKLAG